MGAEGPGASETHKVAGARFRGRRGVSASQAGWGHVDRELGLLSVDGFVRDVAGGRAGKDVRMNTTTSIDLDLCPDLPGSMSVYTCVSTSPSMSTPTITPAYIETSTSKCIYYANVHP